MEDEDRKPVIKSLLSCCKFHWKGKLSILVPLLASPILIHGIRNNAPEYRNMYLVVVMACFWITECIPLYVTSLFPLVFLPLFGIISSERATQLFFTDTLVLFVGGLVMAMAIEYSSLHKRIALGTILLIGCSPRRLQLGLILVTSFLSMWMSNTAATAMMCPIVKAVLLELESEKILHIYMTKEEEPFEEGDQPHPSKISMAFYFGIAYAATIGGCGTLIGTGTNLVFKGIYETRFPNSKERVDFPIFMAYSIPIAVIGNLALLYLSLQITHMGLFRNKSKTGIEVQRGTENKVLVKQIISQRYRQLGRISCHEIQVLIVFIFMIVGLVCRKPGFIKGWADIINAKDIGSSAPVILSCFALFALPTQYTFFKYCCGGPPFTGKTLDACLSWMYIHNNIPWGLLFLIGGGFTLAEGSIVSGMAKMIGHSMGFIASCPQFLVVGICIAISIFTTAFSSNVATSNIAIPAFCEMAIAVKLHPLLLTLPSALAMSMAYHLPVSTPPNAIICGYAGIKTKYLAIAGILPTFWAFMLLWLNAMTWGLVVYPGCREFPDWALDSKALTSVVH